MNLRSSSINLWRQVFGTSLSKLINSIGVILLIVLLNLEFTIQEIGLYFFLFAIVDLLSNIAGGLGKAVRKRVSAKEGKQHGYLTTALASTFIMQIVITLLMGLAVLLIPRELIPETLTGITVNLIGSALFLLFTQSTAKILLNYNSGLGYPSRSEWLGKALPGTLFFLLSVVIVYLELSLSLIFLAGAVSYGLSAVLMTLTTRPDLTFRPSVDKLRSLLRFGKWSIPNKIIMNFYGSLDVIVLGLFVTSTTVGYYESSNNLAHLVYTVPYGLGAVLSVKISGLDAEGKHDEIKKIIGNSIPISISIPIGAFFLFLLFGDSTISVIYGEEFLGAYIFLVGLSLKEILASYRKPVFDLNYGLDQPKNPFMANISAVGVNILTVLPLVHFFGGIGVVISTVLAEILRVILLWYFSLEYLTEINYLRLVNPFLVIIPISGLFWLIKTRVGSESLLFIALQAISFIAVYFSSLYIVSQRFEN